LPSWFPQNIARAPYIISENGLGQGFLIKGDISGKFYFDLADAAQAKLDYVSN